MTMKMLVDKIRRLIKALGDLLGKIQKDCPHTNKTHRLFKDCYYGQGYSVSCDDCDACLGSSTGMTVGDSPEERTWRTTT